MLPGMGGRMDPRRMNQMMRQLGIDIQEVEDVSEVVIRTASKEYVFTKPDVTIMTAQGQKTFQVVGNPEVRAAAVAPAPAAAIRDDDVKLVADQTGKSLEEARAALEAAQGDIAEAITSLSA